MNIILRSLAERVLNLAPRRTVPGDRLILAYHNIVPGSAAVGGDASLHLPLAQFERQLRVIAREADIVPLGTLLAEPTRTSRAQRLVAITFDDAYRSAMELGLAACSAADAPGTVFVAPALLGAVPPWDRRAVSGAWSDEDRRRFLWEEKGLSSLLEPVETSSAPLHQDLTIATREELTKALQGSAHTVGNHTQGHANLGALSSDEARTQVVDADQWLRKHFPERYVAVLSYPYGIPPRDPSTALATASCEAGLAVAGGWIRGAEPVDRTAVPRWNVPAGISERGFSIRLRGWLADRT